MNKTAVVFGATGLVGKELVAELFGNNDYKEVITVVRRGLTLTNPKLREILLPDFSGLIQQKDKLTATAYFCCIGTTIKIAGSKEAFRRVDHDIPLQIAQLAQELDVPNLVVISSIGAQANSGNFYLRTKGEMENGVRTAYSGNLKVVRPSFLMGNRSQFRFGEKIAGAFMKVFGWFLIGSLKKFRGIKARDVAKAMIKAAHLPTAKVVYESDELQELASNK
jgi:uncharacterized protein YbjT (DUF2867 family)